MSPFPWVIIASTKYVQDLLNLFLSFKNSEILKWELPYPFSELVKTFWQKKLLIYQWQVWYQSH
jgi:hypothetical protein